MNLLLAFAIATFALTAPASATTYNDTILPSTDDTYYVGTDSIFDYIRGGNMYLDTVTTVAILDSDTLKVDKLIPKSFKGVRSKCDLIPDGSQNIGSETKYWSTSIGQYIHIDSLTPVNSSAKLGTGAYPVNKIVTEYLHEDVMYSSRYYDVVAEVTDVSVSNETRVNITYSDVSRDELGAFGDNTTYTVPVKGLYRITLYVSYDYNSFADDGLRRMSILWNGNIVGGQSIMPDVVNTYAMSAEILFFMDAGDKVYTQLYAYSSQSSVDADCYLTIRLENGYY
jgi:hypothetical protein